MKMHLSAWRVEKEASDVCFRDIVGRHLREAEDGGLMRHGLWCEYAFDNGSFLWYFSISQINDREEGQIDIYKNISFLSSTNPKE